MFLSRLYSEPSNLFDPIEFQDGVNFIFGKKEVNSSKDSLNGIGKSTILEMIDFCLGADFNQSSMSRLFKEKHRLENTYIVLEFEVDGQEYISRRTVNASKYLEVGDAYSVEKIDLKKAKKELFNIIFRDPLYTGCQRDTWFRSLLTFYLKVHKRSKNEFTDPIQYITASNAPVELNQYHLYFMGIDNSIVCENFDHQNSVKDRDAAIREIKRLIERTHSIDIKDANKRIDRLRNEIVKAQGLIESFKLAAQHKDLEEKLNKLTLEIKSLSEENFWDTHKLSSLKESIELKDVLPESKIKGIQKLYSEISKELSSLVKKSLEDAVEFRRNLSKSREEFLVDEIDRLSKSIETRSKKIAILDDERSTLFKSLKAKNAFKDLTEAYLYVGELQKNFADLASKVNTHQDLEKSKMMWRGEDNKIGLEMVTFLQSSSDEIEDFRKCFNYVYDSIYPQSSSSGFSITQTFDNRSKSKISINISFESEESKGWNKGRTLIYDLAIMLNSIKKGLKRPRFLVHDGIFDGMDKAHFVDLYHFVQNEQKKGNRFQYIVTLNEEGTLGESFGETDELTPQKIEDEAIAVLSPKKKLWYKQR